MPSADKAPTPRQAQEATPLSLAVAAEIRAQAGRRRISNVELQRRTRIAKNTLGQIVDGTKVPNVAQLAKICEVLEVSLVELFSNAEAALRAEGQRVERQASGG